jgi:hypothetical protein
VSENPMEPIIDLWPTMDEVRAHPPVKLSFPLVVTCSVIERIGDTRTESGMDLLINPYMRDVTELELINCHAWIEDVDGAAAVYARCANGEYRVNAIGAHNPELPQAHVSRVMPDTEVVRTMVERTKARFHAILAALWQRQQRARDTALVMPVQAGALASMSTAGRVKEARAAALSARKLEVNVASEASAGHVIRERVTIELVMPKSRGQLVRFKGGEEVFPAFKARPRRELAQLVTEELAQRCRPRVMQGALAGVSVAYREGGIPLDDDGEIPAKFRTEVMRVMGMPSNAASKAQRDLVKEAMALLRYAEFHVKPANGKRATYLPLLVVQEFIDAPGGAERRAARLAPNDMLMGSMAEGKRLRIPEALFQIGEDDRDGVRTLAGLQLAYRLAMGTCGTSEKLELFLRRAGLWEWCVREVAKRGMSHVLTELRREFDALRSLAHHDHGVVDIAGGTAIEGEAMGKAVVVYRDIPPWARSSG